ncbi:MAG: biotin--[acetyl-CoA-carboxylase] ligase, partial [Thermoplasmata archaeon]
MALREFYEVLPSTQDRAIALARAGAPPGSRVVARSQTAGRGRLDHRWWSPRGVGVYLSAIAEAPPPPRTRFALAVGTCLAEALEPLSPVPLRVKWPNDLWAEVPAGPARKLAGVLIDEVATPSHGLREVVGVGVNVAPLDPAA